MMLLCMSMTYYTSAYYKIVGVIAFEIMADNLVMPGTLQYIGFRVSLICQKRREDAGQKFDKLLSPHLLKQS